MAAGGGHYSLVLVLIMSFTSSSFQQNPETKIFGIYPGDSKARYIPGSPIQVEEHEAVTLTLVGSNISNVKYIFLTPDKGSCQHVQKTKDFDVMHESTSTSVKVILEKRPGVYHVCFHVNSSGVNRHAGNSPWLTLDTYKPEVKGTLLPLPIQIAIVAVLLVLSGLFSGLNLGLMSLDRTELTIIEKVGSEKEKKYARRIGPLRAKGNLLLCTLLLGNVMVNSTFTILFDDMTNGLIAIISSTVGIVVFGEIIPQAICSRHGLAVGAKTYWLTKFFMIVTFPASYPISVILDKILGEEMGQVYSKEKLQELIRMTADRRLLHDNEANIISGALQLTNKSVEDIMTGIDDVYMLEVSTVLDFDTLSEILRHGYTRVPVYDGEKTNIVSLLNTKDLALIDPDDNTLLSTVCKYYDHKPLFVDYDYKLDTMLQEFLQGNSHMAIVQKLHNAEDKDPYYENVGVVTLEDVIEEILQSEIIDETDMMTDNRRKELRPRKTQLEYGKNLGPHDNRSKLPRQLGFVAFQFLATHIDPFSENCMSRNVLKNLLKKDIVVNVRTFEGKGKPVYIYEKGVPSDRFVLILQGTVEVIVGSSNMVFESGPFSHYGVEALAGLAQTGRCKDYVPDFSVKVLTDVQYMFITQADYLSAMHATRMMRQSSSIHLDYSSDVDKIRTSYNQNQNGTLTNNSPPYCNFLLSNLKDVDQHTKRSTSSLDRLAFFQRKQEPHEILNRIWRTGSDAKERSENYQPDPRKHSMDSAHQGEPPLTSPRKLFADGPHKRWPLSSSQPFKTSSNHKLDFLIEDECGDGEKHESKRTPLLEKPGSAPHSSVLQPPPIYASLAEGESSSIASTGTSPREATLVDAAVSVHASHGDADLPHTSIVPSAQANQTGKVGRNAEQLEMSKFGAGDRDTAPLMKNEGKESEHKVASVNL